MDRLTFGHPITAEVLGDLYAAVDREFGGEVRDAFYFAAGGKKVLSHTDRFDYNTSVLSGRVSHDESVAFPFQPGRKLPTHCMSVFPVDDAYLGLVFTYSDQPLQIRLYHVCSRLLLRAHLERIRVLIDSRLKLTKLQGEGMQRQRELEHVKTVRVQLEVKVRELSEELEILSQSQKAADYARLLGVARAYESELKALRGEFNILAGANDQMVAEIMELHTVFIPKLAEYETTIHDLRMRVGRAETEIRMREKVVEAAQNAASEIAALKARLQDAQKEIADTKSDNAELVALMEKLRADFSPTEAHRRLAQTEEEMERLRKKIEYLGEAAHSLRQRLAEEEKKRLKLDALQRLLTEITNISTKYRDLGIDPVQALDVIRARVAAKQG